MSFQGKYTGVPVQTLAIATLVTPLWAWTQFDSLAKVVFHFESPSSNTAAITITIKASRFGTNANIDAQQQITISPGQEGAVTFESGTVSYQAEAQAASGTQQLRFVGEGFRFYI